MRRRGNSDQPSGRTHRSHRTDPNRGQSLSRKRPWIGHEKPKQSPDLTLVVDQNVQQNQTLARETLVTLGNHQWRSLSIRPRMLHGERTGAG
jgi:hypothetical protein